MQGHPRSRLGSLPHGCCEICVVLSIAYLSISKTFNSCSSHGSCVLESLLSQTSANSEKFLFQSCDLFAFVLPCLPFAFALWAGRSVSSKFIYVQKCTQVLFNNFFIYD